MVHPAKAICHFYLNENLKNPVKGEKNKKDVERGGWVWYISCHLKRGNFVVHSNHVCYLHVLYICT